MPNPGSYTALTALSADGQTAAIDLGSATEAEVTVYLGTGATFGSGTLILQQSFDGGTTYFTVPNFSKTSGTANTLLGKVPVIGGGKIRASLSGSTSPTLNVCIKVEQISSRTVNQFTLTANGSTNVFRFEPAPSYPVTTDTIGSNVLVWVGQGTWGSGTLVLEVSPDGGTTWFKQQAGLSANGIQYCSSVTDTLCRFTLSGATNPSLSIFTV